MLQVILYYTATLQVILYCYATGDTVLHYYTTSYTILLLPKLYYTATPQVILYYYITTLNTGDSDQTIDPSDTTPLHPLLTPTS